MTSQLHFGSSEWLGMAGIPSAGDGVGIDPLLGPEEDVFTTPRSDETGEPPGSVADSHAVLDDGFEDMLAEELFPASGSQGDTDKGGHMMGAYDVRSSPKEVSFSQI